VNDSYAQGQYVSSLERKISSLEYTVEEAKNQQSIVRLDYMDV